MAQNRNDGAEKKIRTLEDDISTEGGALNDHGVVFDDAHTNPDEHEPAEIKQSNKTAAPEPYQKQNSILTNTDDVFDVSGAFKGSGESGVIVTDKKRKERSFGGALADAFTEWVGDAQKKAEEKELIKKKPKGMQVAPAKMRAETIQEARKNTVQTPVDDHRIVLQKIRTLDTDAEKITGKPYLIKEEQTKDPSWTHTTNKKEALGDAETRTGKIKPASEHGYARVAPTVSEHSNTPLATEKSSENTTPKTPKAEQKETEREPKLQPVPPEKQPEVKAAEKPTPLKKQQPAVVPQNTTKNTRKKRSVWRLLFSNLFRRGPNRKQKAESRSAPLQDTQHEQALADEKRAQAEAQRSATLSHEARAEKLRRDEKRAQAETFHSTTHEGERPEQQAVRGYAAFRSEHPKTAATATEYGSVAAAPSREDAVARPAFHAESGHQEASETKTDSVSGTSTRTHAHANVLPRDIKTDSEPTKKEAPRRVESTKTGGAKRTLLLIGVALCAIGAGVVASYLLVMTQKDAGVLELPSSIVSFVVTDARTAVPLSADRSTFLSDIEAAVSNAEPGITQIYPVWRETDANEKAREVPASTREIFTVLEPRAPSPFIRSLEEHMMIGAVTTAGTNAPFFIMKSEDFDVAFSGMLAWEPQMSADLAPLFGPPVSRTFDEDARTLAQTVAATFRDTVVENHGVRILYDENARERIVYTFLDRETIILTTKVEALSLLLKALRSDT